MPVETKQQSAGHEERDAIAKWIFGLVILLLVAGLAIHGIMAGFLGRLRHTPFPSDQWRPIARLGRASHAVSPGPKLQISPLMDLQSFRLREESELHVYGWINRTSGVVRIPIERAMELVLQTGFPTRPDTNQNAIGPSTYELIQRRLEHREPEIKR